MCSHLVSNTNRKCQKELQMSTVQLKLLLNVVCKDVDNTCTFFLGVWIVIWGPDGEEPVALRSLQVPWPLKFLTKLNFILYLVWTILKEIYIF